MKNFIKLLMLISAFPVLAQNGYHAISSDVKSHLNRADPAWSSGLRDRILGRQNSRALRSLVIDYDLCDEVATIDSGGTQQAFRWLLNSRYSEDTSNNYNLKWGAVAFNSLIDAADCSMVPYGLSSVTVDSIAIIFLHDNLTSLNDSIIISLRDYRGANGVQINASNNLLNSRLWSDTMVANYSLASVSGAQWGVMTVFPNYTLNAGDKFVVSLEYFGPFSDEFSIYASYKDLCADQCGAEPSIFLNNSFVNLILITASNNLSGVPQNVGLFLDCDGSNGPTPLGCEEFYIQNLGIIAYVSTSVPFSAFAQSIVDSVCPGETVPLSVGFAGESDPNNVQITWRDPANNVVNIGPTYDAVVDTTITFTVIVSDIGIAADTVTITVRTRGISVDAGADQAVACGGTANLLGTYSFQPGGQLNAVFHWSSNAGPGPSSLAYNNVGPGTYTLTASNRYGCTASDQVIVSTANIFQNVLFLSDATNNIACKDSIVTFTNNSSQLSGWSWKWTFSDDPGVFATTQNATHVFTALTTSHPDTVTLTADSAGCSLEFKQVYQVQPCSFVGLDPGLTDNLVSIYPNPTEGVFNIDFKWKESSGVTISIFDVHGKNIFEEAIEPDNNARKTIDLSQFSGGLYFVKIGLGNSIIMKKLHFFR